MRRLVTIFCALLLAGCSFRAVSPTGGSAAPKWVAPVPPMPPMPQATTSPQATVASPEVTVQPQEIYFHWAFDFKPVDFTVVFIVQSTTNLSLPRATWPVKAITTNIWVTFVASNPAEFFEVSTSNHVMGT